MAKKLSYRELSALRAAYLARREELLIKKVDALSVKLFEKVFNEYLIALEQNNGQLVRNDRNLDLIKGLDSIYQAFQRQNNIPVVKEFITNLQGIAPLNERYFSSITGRDVRTSLIKVQAVVNKRLGVDGAGNLKEGGFADKFIKDPTLLRTIKRETGKALTNKMGFQEFRVKLKETIQGNPAQKLSGGLQQYYRGYAYDTFARVDRLNQDVFAKDLGLRYFFWSGGVIKTTRPICLYCNGKIVDSEKFRDLEFDDLKEKYQPGLNEDWVPMTDLGQFNCRHRKDYILSSVAERMSDKWLDVDSLLK